MHASTLKMKLQTQNFMRKDCIKQRRVFLAKPGFSKLKMCDKSITFYMSVYFEVAKKTSFSDIINSRKNRRKYGIRQM